jgi:hypothetical protein
MDASPLGGLELSSFLIHRLVEDLRITIPSLHTFSTLSPVSALVPWLLSVCLYTHHHHRHHQTHHHTLHHHHHHHTLHHRYHHYHHYQCS